MRALGLLDFGKLALCPFWAHLWHVGLILIYCLRCLVSYSNSQVVSGQLVILSKIL